MKRSLLVLTASLLCGSAATAQLLSDRNPPAANAPDNFSPPALARYQPPRPMEWPVATLGEAQQKQFTVVQHFEYLQRVYTKSALLEPLEERVPESEFDPESVLQSLVSAKLQGDYQWWLSLWDKAAREKISSSGNDLSADYWPAHWPTQLSGQTPANDARKKPLATSESSAETDVQKPIQLRRWVLTGQVVMITYRLGKGADAGTEFPLVLALSEGKWLATLDYLDDPVMRKLMPPGLAQATAAVSPAGAH